MKGRFQRAASGVFLGVLGFWLNGFPLQVWNGVDCLPGPLITYLTIGLFGTRMGVLQATISASRTVMIWQHPWGMFLLVCEALVAGLLRSRNVPLAASALLFWLLPGLPLVLGVYRGHLGLSWQFAGMTFISDFLCSLISGAVVQLLLASKIATRLSGRLAAKQQPASSLRADAFAAFLLAATVPLASWLAFSGNRLREKSELRAKAELVLQAQLVRDCVEYRVGLLNASASYAGVDQARRLELLRAALGDVVLVNGPESFSKETGDRIFISSSGGRGPWIRFSLKDACGTRITIGDVRLAVLDGNGRLTNQYALQAMPTSNSWFAPAETLLRRRRKESGGSFEFLREGVDPFRRPRYLAGEALLASGGRVISYHPASGVDPSTLGFQQLTISWIGAVSLLAVIFALWFGRRLMTPLRNVRMHLELAELGVEVKWQNVAQAPEELRAVWSSVDHLQLRIRQETQRAEALISEVRQHTEQKSHFLATVSHEVRTPLNAILGMMPQLKKDVLTLAQTTAISRIEQASEHLLSVLNEILDFSKIEKGSIEVNPEKLDLIVLVESALQILERQAFEKRLDLGWTFDADVPRHINADAVRVRQVLFNLVTNAIKFTDTGTIRVKVQKSDRVPNGVQLKVIDTGRGIKADKLGKIYQPFAQLSSPVGSEPNTGAGLGLSIVKHLLEAMGGTIDIQSLPGEGTAVTVDLPGSIAEETGETADRPNVILVGSGSTASQLLHSHLKYLGYTVEICEKATAATAPGTIVFVDFITRQAQQTEIQAIEQSGARVFVYETREQAYLPASCELLRWPPSIKSIEMSLDSTDDDLSPQETSVQSSESHPIRILVAEDSSVNREVVQLMLRSHGHLPMMVNDGERAWAALQTFEFELAILDLRMPGIHGLDLARRCKNELRYQPMLCALTASAFATDRALAQQAGFDAFITKPLRAHELHSVLAQCERRDPKIWNEKTLTGFLDLLAPAGPAKAQAVLDSCWLWLENPKDRFRMEFLDEAHTLKGTASLIGATLLAEYFENLEASLMDASAVTPEAMTVADLRRCVEREFQRIVISWSTIDTSGEVREH